MLATLRPVRVLKAQAGRKTSMGQPGTLWYLAGGPHYEEQMYVGEMGEKEKWRGSFAVERVTWNK